MEAPRAVDLFSGGGGGWCLALRALGGRAIGLEWDAPSCATRAVVGLTTIRTDVATYPAERFAGKVDGVMGSPPCQSFSSAGKRAGLDDPRGQLIYEPMRYVRAIRPRWVALEQVPEVLGYWRWIAREMATMGYSTWAGILNAARIMAFHKFASGPSCSPRSTGVPSRRHRRTRSTGPATFSGASFRSGSRWPRRWGGA